MHTRAFLGLWVGLTGSLALAADWPSYRGPQQDGISRETGWKADFTADGPPVLWEAQIGMGFSSCTVSNGIVYTTGHGKGQDEDAVHAFDALTGRLLWQHRYAAELGAKYYEGGTSATPTADGGRVYHLSRWGDVFCFDAKQGDIIWQRQVRQENNYPLPTWGYAGAPFIDGDRLIINVGDGGVALSKTTGEYLWKSGNQMTAGYSTPYPMTWQGQPALVLSTEVAWYAINPTTGARLWEFPWKTQYGVNAAQPIHLGSRLLISSGYGTGAALLDLTAPAPKAIWSHKKMRAQFNSGVLLGEYVYGIDDDHQKKPSLVCMDFNTGDVKWSERSIGFGALMAADGKLIVITDKGELVIVDPQPSAYTELARAQVLNGRCWSAPVLANGLLYVRNSNGLLRCLDMRP